MYLHLDNVNWNNKCYFLSSDSGEQIGKEYFRAEASLGILNIHFLGAPNCA